MNVYFCGGFDDVKMVLLYLLVMGTVGGDDMLTSNHRRHARGGSRFFRRFSFSG